MGRLAQPFLHWERPSQQQQHVEGTSATSPSFQGSALWAGDDGNHRLRVALLQFFQPEVGAVGGGETRQGLLPR